MAYGITIYNSSTNSVQIDENYKNLVLYGGASENNTTTTHPLDNNGLLSVGVQSGYSVLPFSPVGTGLNFFQTSYKICRLAYGGYAVKAPIGTVVKTYNFTTPEPITGSSGYGLAIYNQDNELTYHSNYKPLRIQAVLTGSNYTSPYPTVSLPAGRQFAFAFLKWSGRYSMDKKDLMPGGYQRDWEQDQYGLGVSLTGNTFATETEANMKPVNNYHTLRLEYGGPYQSRDFIDRSYAIMIADVTNY